MKSTIPFEKEKCKKDQTAQYEGFVSLLDICLKEEACELFQIWGFTDKHSWLNNSERGFNYPLPWDMDMKPKPTVDMMIEKLEEYAAKQQKLPQFQPVEMTAEPEDAESLESAEIQEDDLFIY